MRQPTRHAGSTRAVKTPLGPEQMQVSPQEVQILLFVVLLNGLIGRYAVSGVLAGAMRFLRALWCYSIAARTWSSSSIANVVA